MNDNLNDQELDNTEEFNNSSSVNSSIDLSTICPYTYRNINPNNQLITEDHINKIFKKFKVKSADGNTPKINNLTLYQEAFVYENYVKPNEAKLEKEPELSDQEKREIISGTIDIQNCVPLQEGSYDCLEFLGDRVLDLIVADYINSRYPGKDDGFWTELKTKLVRGSSLCIFAKKMKFHRYILMSRATDGDRHKENILEDSFEAFLGAIYTDFGRRGQAYEICKDLVFALMQRYLNMSQIIRRNDNYKKQLLEYYHFNFKKPDGTGYDPEWVCLSTYGPTNNRIFKGAVKNIDGHIIATGEGRQKNIAFQMASKEALKYFGQEVYSDSEEPTKDLYSHSDSESL
jgi:ribonuclease-3